MKKGKFITIEGIDGAGKSTVISHIVSYLNERLNVKTIGTRDPGGTDFNYALRELLLKSDKLTSITELLLFTAMRQELVYKVILPNINSGISVVCDRFIDSTYAYQGIRNGLLNESEPLEELTTKYAMPDHTFILDIDPRESFKRIKSRDDNNRFDNYDLESKEIIRQAFLHRAKDNPRYTIIDANRSLDDVLNDINDKLCRVFNRYEDPDVDFIQALLIGALNE
jgi:dTMP kinase